MQQQRLRHSHTQQQVLVPVDVTSSLHLPDRPSVTRLHSNSRNSHSLRQAHSRAPLPACLSSLSDAGSLFEAPLTSSTRDLAQFDSSAWPQHPVRDEYVDVGTFERSQGLSSDLGPTFDPPFIEHFEEAVYSTIADPGQGHPRDVTTFTGERDEYLWYNSVDSDNEQVGVPRDVYKTKSASANDKHLSFTGGTFPDWRILQCN